MDLAIRTYFTRGLGLEVTGQYQAAWSISLLVTALVLGALAVDYFPRVAAEKGCGPGVARHARAGSARTDRDHR